MRTTAQQANPENPQIMKIGVQTMSQSERGELQKSCRADVTAERSQLQQCGRAKKKRRQQRLQLEHELQQRQLGRQR